MKCEMCNVNEATIYLKQVVDGDEKELFVCEECANKHKVELPSSIGLGDFLFGVGVSSQPLVVEKEEKSEKSCPHCHLRLSDLNKKSRVGCEHCYEVFADELKPMLESMQKGFVHSGKVPVSERYAIKIRQLEQNMARAIERQDFEQAAVIRDNIMAIKESGCLTAEKN